MKIAIIGRSEYMYETMVLLHESNYDIRLIVTAKGAPEYIYQSSDFKRFAEATQTPFLHQPQLTAQQLQELASVHQGLDAAVSINYSGVISADIVNMFPLGILNLHAGDLPKYRGNAPVAWAMLRNESRIGLCVHKMIGGQLDSGDIIVRDYFPIGINTRIAEVFQWIRVRAPGMMRDALRLLQADPSYVLERQSPDPHDALRGYPRLPIDARIDWNRSNEDVLRLINVSSEPFSGAYCDFNGQQMNLWRAEILEDGEQYCAAAGQITEIRGDGCVVVTTGAGKLVLSEVSVDGNRARPASFIKSIRTRLL
ncbi:MAG: hypothetical protein KF752_20150 [Pirellulaceae bacterium]|nr:hypothetical protein [Pirellulaceae bacterium]